ncbi:serine/threonine-protein kinase [Couchioplanes caeruleus]|uniref:Serine/threonine protein kinase n=1 Tax=Couchioplanes caeruleus TaxID=56438 RepID=A0A3N1GVD5_9ACTN|nr:serine/threonine-protein kinase [Couchioplanes caeruleus]ROP34178.1 serine/threonine protein kinase [Couchioplanes caeruleus]
MDIADRADPLRRGDPGWLGEYRLLGRLGSGGMGVVYLAEDRDDALVAIKLIHSSLSHDPEFRHRFRSEVERARQVPSFCTAEVLDADLDHDPPYLVVEYVDGPSLADVVEERGPLRSAALHSLAVGVATALSGIHGAGVIHRDLKPDNVLLAPGSPKVIDFGIARAFEATSQLTRTDQMVGTVAYMAPERFSSDPGTALTAAADVFGWGCVVAYAGTGRTPFQGDSPTSTAARILTQPPHLDGLPQPLRDLVELALAKDPRDRPSARELVDLLLGDRPAVRPPARPQAPAAAPPRPQPPAAAPPRSAPHDHRTLVALDRRTLVAAPGGGAPAPARGGRARGHTLLATLAVLLVLAGIGTVGFVLNAGARSRTPIATSPSPGGGVGAGAQTSPDPSEEREPEEPTGGEPLIQDSLDRPGQWFDSQTRAGDARCVTRGGLRAELAGSGAFQCLGPTDDVPDDAGIEVSTTLLTAGSCAVIWFHWDDEAGGQALDVCQDEIAVATDTPSGRSVLGRVRLEDRVPLREPTRIHLVVREGAAQVFLAGEFVGKLALPGGGPDTGQVRLGLSAEEEGAGPPYAVSFADVDIRSLPAAG